MFRLSLALGIPVNELFDRIPSETFEWYLAWSLIEPFGAIHDERRAMTGAVASLSPHLKKGKELGLDDMSPYLADCPDIGTDSESKDRARAMKAEATLRSFVAMPGWRKVEPEEETE